MRDAGGSSLALVLAAAGALVALYSFLLLRSVPLAALGVGTAIVGASIALTSAESPYREYLVRSAEAALSNLARILEEFGVSGKAVYVAGGDKVYMVVPLSGQAGLAGIDPGKLENRFLATVDGVDCLVLESPLRAEPGGDPEASASFLLVDALGLADSVRLSRRGEELVAEVSGVKAWSFPGRLRQVAGSLVACAVCTAAAASYGRPVVFREERAEKRGRVVVRAALAEAS